MLACDCLTENTKREPPIKGGPNSMTTPLSLSMSLTHTKREYSHRARTMCAPCQVFEQFPQLMVYQERGCRWYLVGSEVLPFPLVGSQWLLSYPVISWWALDGHCDFLTCPCGLQFGVLVPVGDEQRAH